MSDYYKALTLSYRHKKLQWLNGIVHLHDMHCQCSSPFQHTIIQIIEEEPDLPFTKEDIEKLQKCHTDGDGDGGADPTENIGDGDLERLFAQDVFGEENAAG